ncbi:MAG: type II toxin-antitoxin system HipA family toxin [Bacteroidales bacterium]|nr:type II toxin-antitoxin system HipA family toxin [Bacteroidales bacterium]
MTKTLKVFLWGKEVGRLCIDSHRRLPYFEYNQEWIQTGLDVSPLDASIKLAKNLRPIFGATEKIYQKLPPFLADSLPDAWGNELFEQWRQQQGIKFGEITPLDKLAFIGKRAMGAFEFVPETFNFQPKENIDLKALINLANYIYSEREKACINQEQSLTMQALMAVGTSAGGRQPKAIIAINHQTGEIRSGQVSDLEGFDYCILKLGNNERSTAELEKTYYDMATKAGIQMTPCWTMEIEGTRHFVTRRFDRVNGKKLHMQTLAALYPEADSYERLLWVCRKMRLSEHDSQEIFRRMIFNILANNTDDHIKNFSFLMDEQGKWSVSPAYDMTYIFNTGGYLPETNHCLMIRGKYINISLQDVLDLAEENSIRNANRIIGEVKNALTSFRSLATKNGVREEWIGRIESCLNGHLGDWGFPTSEHIFTYTDETGQLIEKAHIEASYKGNYHLIARIGNRERKYIIRKGTPEHDMISRTGFSNLTENIIRELVNKYFLTPRL